MKLSDTKRYYWLKLKEDFFRQKEIKQLRKIAGGPVFTIIYLKMLLRCMSDNGRLYFEGVENDFASELALDIDESVEDVRMTLNFLQAKGILVQCNVAEWEVLTAKEMTGSECDSARRMRRMRMQKAIISGDNQLLMSQSDGTASHSDNDVTECDTEIDIEKENREKSEKRKRFTPPTVDEVQEYVTEKGYDVDPERFVNYYTAIGWKVSGKSPMKDWKAAVRNWVSMDKKRNSPQPSPSPKPLPAFMTHEPHKEYSPDERKAMYREMGFKVD